MSLSQSWFYYKIQIVRYPIANNVLLQINIKTEMFEPTNLIALSYKFEVLKEICID
ncbi:hypothetical protein IWX76_000580 [Pedobacter sp. CAN_A7]